MKVRFRLAVLFLAIAGALGVASPAMAQGGGGGGGGGTVTVPGCAYFNSWTTSVQNIQSAPGVWTPTGVLRVGVYQGCVDEGVGAKKGLAVSEDFYDTATGKWLGASVQFANFGQQYFNFYFSQEPSTTPSGVTLKFSITRPNGQLQDVRYTTPEELRASLQSAA